MHDLLPAGMDEVADGARAAVGQPVVGHAARR
jgi:hypothetical protein